MMKRPKLVDYMTKFPQRCLVTNYPNKKNQDPVLDTGLDIPEYGRVYISAIGMRMLAEKFGYAPADATKDTYQAIIFEKDARIAELEDQTTRIPAVLERTLHGFHELSVVAVNDLLGRAGVDDDHPDAAASEANSADGDGNAEQPAGGDDPAAG